MIENLKKIDRVLLIDDDDIVNKLNEIILTQSKLVDTVIAVRSADKAMQVLTRCQNDHSCPAVILVDINMPAISGWDFIEMFRKKFSFQKPNCVIAMLTSSLDNGDKQRAAENADMIDFYISKPLTTADVSMLVEKNSIIGR